MFPKAPSDNYGSNIRTESPFSQGMIRQASAVPKAYTGQNAGRSAFARALSDDASSQTKNQFDLDNAEYQQKAQKARAQDVQGRRESMVQGQGLDRQLGVANATLEQQGRLGNQKLDQAYAQSKLNIGAFMKRAKQDFMVNSITGLAEASYGPFMRVAEGPTSQEMYMALKAKNGGGPYEGITSGDILAAGSPNAGFRGGFRGAGSTDYYDMPQFSERPTRGGLLSRLR